MPAILDKHNLDEFLELLAREYQLFLPVRENGLSLFKQFSRGLRMDLEYINTETSPKGYLFPQTEKILSYSQKGCKDISLASVLPEKESQVIFGIRSCDLAGIKALDPVFSGRYPDPHYSVRRENTLLVGLGCLKTAPTCFCKAFNIDPLACNGADVVLFEMEDCFAVEARNEKGRELLEQVTRITGTKADSLVEAEKARVRERLQTSFSNIPNPAGAKETLDRHFELPCWNEISQRCIGCGICTYICPTCHCFDIFDFARGKPGGSRFRCWDSCMFPDFTRMAGGHNPRPTKKERVRNRFMHKIKYHLDRYDINGCTGCGRCLEKCPVNIDIKQIIKELSELKEVESSGQ